MSSLYMIFPVFKNEPPSAANRAQDQRTVRKAEGEDASYLTSVKNLMSNPGYVLLLFTYGMNVGVFYAISTLLSTTVVQHFEVISETTKIFTLENEVTNCSSRAQGLNTC